MEECSIFHRKWYHLSFPKFYSHLNYCSSVTITPTSCSKSSSGREILTGLPCTYMGGRKSKTTIALYHWSGCCKVSLLKTQSQTWFTGKGKEERHEREEMLYISRINTCLFVRSKIFMPMKYDEFSHAIQKHT